MSTVVMETGEFRVLHHAREFLLGAVDDVVGGLLGHLENVEPAAVGVEHLNTSRTPLVECLRSRTGVDEWFVPALQQRLTAALLAEGYRVEYVDPDSTTRLCHRCSSEADVRPNTIQCTTETCPVETVCRDRSAAVTIAQRATTDG
jgi:hypothetical protein